MSESAVRVNQVIDRCDSTNLVAKQLIHEGFSHGTWISSRIQEKGRGRLGRVWKSEEGNLFLSIILEVENRSVWSWVPLCVATAVSDCIRKQNPSLSIQIKWPNDLWINQKKLGGILCESIPHQGKTHIIAGIGLNYAHAPALSSPSHSPSLSSSVQEIHPQNKAHSGSTIQSTSLKEHVEDLECLSLDQLRLDVIESVLSFINELNHHGVSRIKQLYQQWSVFSEGTQVSWGEDEQKKTGKVLGLGQYGELQVLNTDGKIEHLYSEDVTVKTILDFII
jgi:biotin-(acetyl-CoA carboxylase) ligase